MMRFASKLAIGFIAMVATWLGASSASAYPRFQFSSDTDTCSNCHYAPAGGGLINAWGRGEAADTLSRGGNGDALHGLVDMPDWLAIGGDVRLATLSKNVETNAGTVTESGKLHVFPMQAELAGRAEKGEFSFQAVVGLRAKARKSAPPMGSSREEAGALSRLISREHFLTYAPEGSKYSARAGRFYAPYGLRLADHTTYVRRRAGFGNLQETYGVGVSRRGSESETHLTAHISDPILGSVHPTVGATAMHEMRGEAHALGLGSRLLLREGSMQAWAGSHYKKWFSGSNLLLMAELNAGYQRFSEAPDNSRMQLLGYAGPVWVPTQGVSASVGYEFFDEDVLTRYVERHALTTTITILPRAHYEIFLLGRAERIGPPGRAFTGMLQLHYYL